MCISPLPSFSFPFFLLIFLHLSCSPSYLNSSFFYLHFFIFFPSTSPLPLSSKHHQLLPKYLYLSSLCAFLLSLCSLFHSSLFLYTYFPSLYFSSLNFLFIPHIRLLPLSLLPTFLPALPNSTYVSPSFLNHLLPNLLLPIFLPALPYPVFLLPSPAFLSQQNTWIIFTPPGKRPVAPMIRMQSGDDDAV